MKQLLWEQLSLQISNLTILENSVFAIINNLRKHKRTNLNKIYNELIKVVDSENTSKEHLNDRTNELIIQGKIINKTNRNHSSYPVNESIVDFDIDQLEYPNLLASTCLLPHLTLNNHFSLIL